jgi:thioredoxin 1
MTISNYDELINFSKQNPDTLCFVDFYATWCKPCKLLGEFIPQWKREFSTVAFFNVDVDDTSHENTVSIFNISSIPSVLFIKNGITLNLISGFQKELIYSNITLNK